jgi:hypothetical protein
MLQVDGQRTEMAREVSIGLAFEHYKLLRNRVVHSIRGHGHAKAGNLRGRGGLWRQRTMERIRGVLDCGLQTPTP